jgi:hypothetical protein
MDHDNVEQHYIPWTTSLGYFPISVASSVFSPGNRKGEVYVWREGWGEGDDEAEVEGRSPEQQWTAPGFVLNQDSDALLGDHWVRPINRQNYVSKESQTRANNKSIVFAACTAAVVSQGTNFIVFIIGWRNLKLLPKQETVVSACEFITGILLIIVNTDFRSEF